MGRWGWGWAGVGGGVGVGGGMSSIQIQILYCINNLQSQEDGAIMTE